MKKFVVLYHAPASALAETANLSSEEQAKGMEAWGEWADRLGDKLVDMGNPLINGEEIGANGERRTSDKNVSGYSILQAESLEEAKGLLENHPHLAWNPENSIEVHEEMPLPGMEA